MEKKFLVGWLTPEILTNFNLTRQEAQFCIQSVLVPTGLFPVITGIYIPNNCKGLERRLDSIEAKFRENFAKPPDLARKFPVPGNRKTQTPSLGLPPPWSI
jgi:hypothetical protein